MSKPFASKAQMEKFKKFVSEGLMTQEHYDICFNMTKDIENLPERLHPKKEPKAEEKKEAANE